MFEYSLQDFEGDIKGLIYGSITQIKELEKVFLKGYFLMKIVKICLCRLKTVLIIQFGALRQLLQ